MTVETQLELDLKPVKEANLISASVKPIEHKVVEIPFSSNISAGKNTYVYDAHTYHTKVPPEGIKQAIEYYTNPGETVLDPFCGSGMTGVATVETGRRALLSDLSPAAVFIASNITRPLDADRYMQAVREAVDHFKEENRALYSTSCRTCSKPTPVNYTVWSYDVTCNSCHQEFSLFDAAKSEKADVKESKILPEFPCPHCNVIQKKRQLKRGAIKPVLVGYRCPTKGCTKGNKDTNASLNAEDLALLASIKEEGVPAGLWYPTDVFPKGMNTTQPIQAGITSVDKAYTPRALRAMAQLWNYASAIEDEEIKQKLLFTITSLYQRVTVFSEFRFWGGSGNIANYSVPAVMNEQNVFATFLRKAKTIESYFRTAPQLHRDVTARVQSATHLTYLADNSVDYVFTDPPFGSNINYSEMNFLWESWLQHKTETTHEAIVHKVQEKKMDDYQVLLTQAFAECKRVLKPGGWITIVFHNSSDKVWAALQNAIRNAGLQISGAQTFDKQHGTFKQFVSDNAVGYDIMVHCRKEVGDMIAMDSLAAPMTKADVSAFIGKALRSEDIYSVKFLHVNRKQEFDYRKLYAELLTTSISKSLIGIAFDEFRTLVDRELEILNSTKELAH